MARPIKTLKEAIVSKISNGGSDVTVDDNLNLGSSNEIKNASAVSTENLSLASVTGDGVPAQAIEHGKIWADDGQLYDDMSDAESAASNILVIGPGTYTSDTAFNGNEALRINTSGLSVFGCGRNTVLDGGANDGIGIDADGVRVSNLAAKTTSGGGNSARAIHDRGRNACEISNVWIEESDDIGIRTFSGTTELRIVSVWLDSANIDDGDISLKGDNCVVDDIIGTVSDGGTGNSIGETA